ncbi:hypothetical protein phiCbK_032 [Caulobacter phage phiCbK]|uniref:Uncharacterized protein n=4 Tax=Shapirovirus cbk TaxID=1204537 RepID=K4JPZ4_9CAUD|nr:hypothetical protein D865_gp129 [Caulobacter phage phiCbK]AFO71546.1 hypothetical protein phiCbK_032 [Caulobacter phage phiCbK]AFU87121.1 hypothetical protein CbK_gp289 [Caulobacter phage phiCbK]ARB15202.1 hypothetical protein Ccr32_gp284 [Caulobacter phage Ccr32]ARB15536.1 hypothetical protein Ccr34_gp294 [Caulobacter phage Ccr34]
MGLTGCAFAALTTGSVAYAIDRGGKALKLSAFLLLASWAFSVTLGQTLHAGMKPYVYAWVDALFAGAMGILISARLQRWRVALFTLAIAQMGLHLIMIGGWDFSLHARRLHVLALNLTYGLELFVLTIGARTYRVEVEDDMPALIEADGPGPGWLECVDKAREPVL